MKRSAPLKRTGFTRINLTQIQALDRAREHLPTKVHPAVRKAVMVPVSETPAEPVHKQKPVRSEDYRRLVASLPCVICGVPGQSQAAHGSEGKGMGIKASDLELFPACADRPGVRGCHSLLDQGALFTKAVRKELEAAWAADTRRRIQAAGLWPKNVPQP